VGAIPPAERAGHFALLKRLFGEAVLERRNLASPGEGYAFRFDADAFDDVSGFIRNERLCCPFLTFVVELPPDGASIWLSLSGPDGTRAFLDAELP
jgi:hypothetical protein